MRIVTDAGARAALEVLRAGASAAAAGGSSEAAASNATRWPCDVIAVGADGGAPDPMGGFSPYAAGLRRTGHAFVSTAVTGAASSDAYAAAAVSLNLSRTTETVGLSGEIAGAVSVDLRHMGEAHDGWTHLDIRTGEGGDTVSLSMAGAGDVHGATTTGRLYTNGGDDVITTRSSNRASLLVAAGDGDDTINATDDGGITAICGGYGNDTINIRNGSGLIEGGPGNDTINLSWDKAALTSKTRPGGEGFKLLHHDAPSVFLRRGGGQDVVTTTRADGAVNGQAHLVLAGVKSSELEVTREGADLVLGIRGTSDRLTFRDYDPASWGFAEFSDGIRTMAEIVAGAARLDVAA